MKKQFLFYILFITIVSFSQNLPKGFVYLKEVAPTIQTELRYFSHNNFIGNPIAGYNKNVVITSVATAKALHKVQQELLEKGLSLKIFDAYRPQQAVDHFVKWAKKIDDTIMKQQYYPKINKKHLFKLGYIASKSGHSRGSTVDVTIINNQTKEELDMGSPYDFFGNISHYKSPKINKKQFKNRQLLRQIMLKNGFTPYATEWWHFTLHNEPFPKTYFNFPIL